MANEQRVVLNIDSEYNATISMSTPQSQGNTLVLPQLVPIIGVKGEDGTDGYTPIKNIDYFDGQSAYQVWLGLGNAGTQQQFLDSLKTSSSDVRTYISENIEGISYNQSTGIFSLTNGYIIPTLANFNNKVDKELNKGLSTNNFTDELKSKLDLLSVGSTTYKGTYDASLGVYPTQTPTSGNYWVASSEGTIGGTLYTVGDWIIYNSPDGWSRVASSGVQDADVVHSSGDETIYGNKTFDDKVIINERVRIGSEDFDAINPEFLKVDGGQSASSNIISGYGDYDSYVQLNIKNKNTGTGSSSDLVATADIGQEGSNYIDVGINGSNYDDETYSITKALDGYIIVDGGDLAVGTSSPTKNLKLFTGGTLEENIRGELSDTELAMNVNVTAPNLVDKIDLQQVKNMAIAMSIAL